ncbi:MAG: TM0106 family RecB-like putative nuclease [Galactobacter sp.]
MYLNQERQVVTSASDLTAASACEFSWLRRLDEKLDRIEKLERPEDAMLNRTAELGDTHEERILQRFRDADVTVVEIERPNLRDPESVDQATSATERAFKDQIDVVFQATFSDPDEHGLPFVGFADFIIREPDGSYRVQDAKLARRAKVTALLQLAAYAGQLRRIGIPVSQNVDLLLGNGTTSTHRLKDIEPMYRLRRTRLATMVKEHLEETGPVAWNDPRYTQCGTCDDCAAEVEKNRDMSLVYRLTSGQRTKLRSAGLESIDDVAAWTSGDPTGGVPQRSMRRLAKQAALQVRSEGLEQPVFEIHDRGMIESIPQPSEGDLFFDFEGDPLWTQDNETWGLDYLFGMVDARGEFTAFWAHTMEEEKQALLDFLDLVDAKRAEHPDMHIYHYAAYERAHLSSIAQRHGVAEDRVDDLLREQVLVDLYSVVGRGLVLGTPSYSIKKVEALHMAGEHREGVTNAADSVDQYAQYVLLQESGKTAEAAKLLQEIADYNEYDCVSTLKLRDWLRALVLPRGSMPGGPVPDAAVPGSATNGAANDHHAAKAADGGRGAPPSGRGDRPEKKLSRRQEAQLEADALAQRALDLAGDPFDPERSPDQRAWGLAAAALAYHSREDKSFWWEHFARLSSPVEEWEENRNVFFVDQDSREVTRDWSKAGPRARKLTREIDVTGHWTEGSTPKNSDWFAVYDLPGNGDVDSAQRPYTSVKADFVHDSALTITEYLPEWCSENEHPWPLALTPGAPVDTSALLAANVRWVSSALRSAPEIPLNPMGDLLLRRPSRLSGGGLDPVAGGDTVSAVVDSVLRLESSYLAVQGPPGTGKTYVASHVIQRLIEDHGWKIGVVSQSHKVINNVLTRVLKNGVDSELVWKVGGKDDEMVPLLSSGHVDAKAKLIDRLPLDTGYVVGATAWGMSALSGLDLVVVDEAGQYALANTMAVSLAGRNLMLFGDPQQLPQVSQGVHPEPVDTSALGWLSEGHDVLPTEFGYFLPQSWRMDAAVTAPVSQLSYDGQLRSASVTDARHLEGTGPGLVTELVRHEGNSTASQEEADRVVELVRRHLGQMWTGGDGEAARPLTDEDFIVVTPYNAQKDLVLSTLRAAGLGSVPVGTVDKFQGQEAVISITSLAASSGREAPRGLEFVLLRNRLNVSISRAQWKAYLVCSPGLVDKLPSTPAELALMSGFAQLAGM